MRRLPRSYANFGELVPFPIRQVVPRAERANVLFAFGRRSVDESPALLQVIFGVVRGQGALALAGVDDVLNDKFVVIVLKSPIDKPRCGRGLLRLGAG